MCEKLFCVLFVVVYCMLWYEMWSVRGIMREAWLRMLSRGVHQESVS